ncbi:MAG: DUF3299 domain-containing protein [Pseudomonadota bacterium]
MSVMRARIFWVATALAIVSACGAQRVEPTQSIVEADAPPPIPEGAETVAFERVADTAVDPETTQSETTSLNTRYWGVKEGDPLPIMWEDLMPEGSEEALMKEYEAFYAMLEKRYAANSTSLVDADPYARIEEGSELDFMPQLGSFETVEDLDGVLIRMPGYVVPFDFSTDSKHREFLFVPYMGACIHTPPPPPNQIIFVRADPAISISDIWAPYWIEGTLMTEKTENELGNTAYALTMSKIEDYTM